MTTLIHLDAERPASDTVLAMDALHVWTIALDVPPPPGDPADGLSPEERARATRYRFDVDRRRFVTARSALRSILGGYLGVPPAAVAFTTGPSGKPMLDAGRHDPILRFNLSHSHDVALVVVAHDRDVGVDVERLRRLPDPEAIVARFFSADERVALARLPPARRLPAFFRVWTVKEAYLKACGEGFRRDLRQIEVQGGCDQPRPHIRALDHADDRCGWECFQLTPGTGYTAAVVVEASVVRPE
jgi:4'-phosphopantetheinyl transferase